VLKAGRFDFSPTIPPPQLRPLPAHQFNLHPAPQSVRHANQRHNRQIARLILHRRNLRRAHLHSQPRPSAFHRFFQYPEAMQHVTISLPDELLGAFSVQGQDFSRAALEALAIEAYRSRKISAALLRRCWFADPHASRRLPERPRRRTRIHPRRPRTRPRNPPPARLVNAGEQG